MPGRQFPGGSAHRRHSFRNFLQSALLLGGMLTLLSLCAWTIFGAAGALWALAGWVAALILSPRVSPRLVLRLYRAHYLSPAEFPRGFAILRELVRRAGMSKAPALCYIPSRTLNAFTLGRRNDAAIVITDGMLQTLSGREFAGVLAHELSHIGNNDLWVMNLADSIGRLTNLMVMVGGLLLIINLPLLLIGRAPFPWLLVVLLLFAPMVAALLQMGLSRAREYDADLDAAALTGDPAGLASALGKLEGFHARLWERILMPGRRIPEPSLLRSHPPMADRIDRLMSLRGRRTAADFPDETFGDAFGTHLPVRRRPRWRLTGLWH